MTWFIYPIKVYVSKALYIMNVLFYSYIFCNFVKITQVIYVYYMYMYTLYIFSSKFEIYREVFGFIKQKNGIL